MTWQYPETTFRDQVTCSIDAPDTVAIVRRTNFNCGPLERPTLTGHQA